MRYIFTALGCEARPFIACYHLQKDSTIRNFLVFRNDEAGICLTVTGVGTVAAASAVASICTKIPPEDGDFLVNIGICAGGREGVYLCNKLVEQATGRCFYPDVLYRHPFLEENLTTGSRVLQGAGRIEEGLYDMEGAAVYQAGAYFLAPHQMSFIKVVSDDGSGLMPSPDDVRQLMESVLEPITAYLDSLAVIGADRTDRMADWPGEGSGPAKQLFADMHCTKAMEAMMSQYLRYCALTGIDYVAVVKEFYAKGMLPCDSKREGKKCFEELKKRLL